MTIRLSALAALTIPLVLATGAAAHHSYSMFDQTKSLTFQGTVKSFDMVNPHSWLQVVVTTPGGVSTEWSLEMGAPSQLSRLGWSQQTVKAGDKVTVNVYPLRDGSHGGQLSTVVLTGGESLQGGGPPGAAPGGQGL